MRSVGAVGGLVQWERLDALERARGESPGQGSGEGLGGLTMEELMWQAWRRHETAPQSSR